MYSFIRRQHKLVKKTKKNKQTNKSKQSISFIFTLEVADSGVAQVWLLSNTVVL